MVTGDFIHTDGNVSLPDQVCVLEDVRQRQKQTQKHRDRGLDKWRERRFGRWIRFEVSVTCLQTHEDDDDECPRVTHNNM